MTFKLSHCMCTIFHPYFDSSCEPAAHTGIKYSALHVQFCSTRLAPPATTPQRTRAQRVRLVHQFRGWLNQHQLYQSLFRLHPPDTVGPAATAIQPLDSPCPRTVSQPQHRCRPTLGITVLQAGSAVTRRSMYPFLGPHYPHLPPRQTSPRTNPGTRTCGHSLRSGCTYWLSSSLPSHLECQP